MTTRIYNCISINNVNLQGLGNQRMIFRFRISFPLVLEGWSVCIYKIIKTFRLAGIHVTVMANFIKNFSFIIFVEGYITLCLILLLVLYGK